MNPITRLLPIACLGAALVSLGCASTTKAPEPVASEAETTASADTGSSAELGFGEAGAPELAPVYFDTDQSLLRADARDALKRYARVIQEHPEWGVVTIEGHCDERGSEEYNLALGGRRAATVVRYLTDLGVPSARLQSRTFGEARPAVAGHDESSWRLNRRAELESEARDSAQR